MLKKKKFFLIIALIGLIYTQAMVSSNASSTIFLEEINLSKRSNFADPYFDYINQTFSVEFFVSSGIDSENFMDRTPNTTMKIYSLNAFTFHYLFFNNSDEVMDNKGTVRSGGLTYNTDTTELSDGKYTIEITLNNSADYLVLTRNVCVVNNNDTSVCPDFNSSPTTSSFRTNTTQTMVKSTSSTPSLTTSEPVSTSPGFVFLSLVSLLAFQIKVIYERRRHK